MSFVHFNTRKNIIELCKILAESNNLTFVLGTAASGVAGAVTADYLFGKEYRTMGAVAGSILYTVATQSGLMDELSLSDLIDSVMSSEDVNKLVMLIYPLVMNLGVDDLNHLKIMVLKDSELQRDILSALKNFLFTLNYSAA